MSEGFSDRIKNHAEILTCGSIEPTRFYNHLNVFEFGSGRDLNLSYDHMYASNTENCENGVKVKAASTGASSASASAATTTITEPETSCHTAEKEVRFLKDFLTLHLDLIRQQSDELLSKEKQILILQKENEMLKERIRCMEQGTPFLVNNQCDIPKSPQCVETSCGEDMTLDSGPCEEENKDNIEIDYNFLNGSALDNIKIEQNLELSDDVQINIGDTIINVHDVSEPLDIQSEVTLLHDNSDIIAETDSLVVSVCDKVLENSSTRNNILAASFVSDSPSESDPMRSLRMNIRRKRVGSNSSAVSTNDCSIEEKKPYRRFRKKRKRAIKNIELLTTPEQYISHANEVSIGISSDLDPPIPLNRTLEVPRWRVKVYASCYTMEGTENLDDEVFNKRHSRLENDERRRKRWDIQRIREQRSLERLKRRQDAGASGSKEEQNESLQSLWPKLDDIKFIEICDELPVSAFGCPIPKLPSCEFSLPWITNPGVLTKKVPANAKRSSCKRRSTKR